MKNDESHIEFVRLMDMIRRRGWSRGEGDVIRFMRWHEGRRGVFAKGNALDNVWLWFRGYRYHDTAFGWLMAKWTSASAGGEREAPNP